MEKELCRKVFQYSSTEPIVAEKVIDDIDVYLELVYRFKLFANRFYSPKVYNDKMLCASFGEQYGVWSSSKNKKIYSIIDEL